MIVSCLLCNTIGKQNRVSPLTKKKTKETKVTETCVHRQKGISMLLDTYCFGQPLLFLCLCFTHCVFIRPYTVLSPVSAMNDTNCCCRKGNLPALICCKTNTVRGAGGLQQWSVRKLPWTKAAFSGTSPPRSHLTQSCTRPVPAQWASKQRAFSEYLWEELSHRQTEHFLQ